MYKEKSKITLETEGSKLEVVVPRGFEFEVSFKMREVEKQKGLTSEARLVKRKVKEYEELITKGIVPKHLQHLRFKDAKKETLKHYIDAMKWGLHRYDLRFDREKLELGEFRDMEEFVSYFEDFFRIGYKHGIENLAGNSINRVQANSKIKENSIKIVYKRHLIITDDAINYVDSENNVKMRMEEKGVKRNQLKVVHYKDNKYDVIYEKENYGTIKIIENGELLDNKKIGLEWKKKSEHDVDPREYKKMSLTINGQNLSIKTAHLYILLSTNELVLLLCTISGASIFNIDHMNGIVDDNRIKVADDNKIRSEDREEKYAKSGNLQIITNPRNVAKTGNYEDHMRISWETCYDYMKDLLIVSEIESQKVEQSTNRPA